MLTGDCRAMLKRLPERSVHCAVTSPPYFGLRDYGSGTWVGGDLACDHTERLQNVAGSTLRNDGRENVGTLDHEKIVGIPYKGQCAKCGARLIEPAIWGGSAECGHVWGDLLHGESFCQRCGAWRGAFGLEPTPELYVQHTVEIFREIWRVLRDDGQVWLNLGDSYAGSGKGGNPDEAAFRKQATNFGSLTWTGDTARQATVINVTRNVKSKWNIKPKDRMMIPHRVAIALCDDGWWVRDEIVWSKNGMPESVEDRCCKAHEFIFMLSKERRYFYDHHAIMEMATFDGPSAPDGKENSRLRIDRIPGKSGSYMDPNILIGGPRESRDNSQYVRGRLNPYTDGVTRVCRSVWRIGTKPYPGAHFAVYPDELPERCIKAGTSDKGCCPKCGAPWRRVVARMGEPDIAHQIACGGDADGRYNGQATKDYESAGAQDASAVKSRILDGMRQKMTLGWYPTCECIGAPPLPKYPKRPGFKAHKEETDVWERECRRIDAEVKYICDGIKSSPVVPATVLDPFGGAGTTSLVAERLRRDSVYIDLNSSYAELARNRIAAEAPLLTRFIE